jgi:hypothetical protein
MPIRRFIPPCVARTYETIDGCFGAKNPLTDVHTIFSHACIAYAPDDHSAWHEKPPPRVVHKPVAHSDEDIPAAERQNIYALSADPCILKVWVVWSLGDGTVITAAIVADQKWGRGIMRACRWSHGVVEPDD